MGGTTFMIRVKGKSADAAFRAAVKDAQHEHGHGGYTGTIAEKSSFVTFVGPVDKSVTPEAYAGAMLDDENSQVYDKWGPAGCIKVAEGEYLFFGWASE